ncbi:Plasmodium variant antigen protein Cir/Yir/Bir, putative, partial [Plasmodium chabaudi adami]
GKNVNTKKINEEVTIKSYCYNDDCKTNEDSINALTAYIFMEFKNSINQHDYNKYDECFLMWLSDKLLKMYYESKGKNVKKGFVYLITLNQAYDKYLKQHKVKLNYWDLFDNIKGLKEANLIYMAEFYKLLNNICKTIADYKDNGAGTDSYFKGKNVNTKKINEEVTIKSYCYNDDCKTNEDSINALTAYIFMEFKNSINQHDYNKYDECFLMWLSDKLLKMYYESKGKNVKKGFVYLITLNQAYDKYLKQHKVKLNYWDLFDNIKGLKEANLIYMAEFYKLLNNICKTIADYKDNGAG